jgi:hypothetical protein
VSGVAECTVGDLSNDGLMVVSDNGVPVIPGAPTVPTRREVVAPGGVCRVVLRTHSALFHVTKQQLDNAMGGSDVSPSGTCGTLQPVRGGVRGGSWRRFPARARGVLRFKLLQFHDNIRPAYWGTFNRRRLQMCDAMSGETATAVVPRRLTGRKPLAHDTSLFNYDVSASTCRPRPRPLPPTPSLPHSLAQLRWPSSLRYCDVCARVVCW